MERPRSPSRRQLLGGMASVVGITSLAGCIEGDESPEESGSEETTTETPGDTTATDDEDEPETDSDPTLDLREANVVEVAFEPANGGYDFDVALHHDDDGEAGYADRWQVEDLDGRELGRRELLHAHSTQPFTRSATIDVPDDVSCVVVRGHDQTHGFGGRLVVVNLDSGDTRAIDQGPERQPVERSDCP